jgi:hypothetical protein
VSSEAAAAQNSTSMSTRKSVVELNDIAGASIAGSGANL